MKAMTVAELIALLQTKPQDLPVCYPSCSEHVLLEAYEVQVAELCEARADGWVQDKRPDMPTQLFLVLHHK